MARQLGPKRFADACRKNLLEALLLSDDAPTQFTESDKQACRAYAAAQDYTESKRLLTRTLLRLRTVSTSDRTAERVIRSIGLNEPLPADRILQPILAADPKQYETYGLAYSYLEDSELEDVSWNEFHGWYSVDGYVLGQIVTRVLVTPKSPPEVISTILSEIQMCYAFGQTTAIYGLCRTLIETALTDVCVRIGALTQAQVASDFFFKDFPPAKRIHWTLRGSYKAEAFELYTATSRVIHGNARASDATPIVRRSIALVERLYSLHA